MVISASMKLLTIAATFAGLLAAQTPGKTQLKPGDIAPDFTLRGASGSENKEYKLSDYKGKKVVVLAFFPAAFTGG
jgi:peroxiredoxin Q/BCP